MISQNKLTEIGRRSPFFLAAFWSLLLLVNFVPVIPQPGIIIGYLWKVEFALAGLILLTLIITLGFRSKTYNFVKLSVRERYWIVAPIILFTVWSGLSMIWAESWRNALHHTLLWACYAMFYLLIRQITARPKLLDISLKAAGVVVAILGLLCLIEYLDSDYETSLLISSRYGKYAECIAALLPVFIALTVKTGKNFKAFALVTILGWTGIILSLSRTQFLAASFGILAFLSLIIISRQKIISWKKLLICLGLLASIAIISQSSLFVSDSKQSTLNRFSADESSQTSFQVRFLYWNLALEMFKRSPIIGVGADDFRSNYNSARTNFAISNPSDPQVNLYETVLPERAHNEYVQILAELGIVGALSFGWLMFGIIALVFSLRKKPISLISLASLAGIIAFLISSLTSSYSFRVPANGVCFFFLLALAVRGFETKRTSGETSGEKYNLIFPKLKPVLISCGILVCTVMLIFSAVRGVSLMYLQTALAASDQSTAEANYQLAIALDDQEPLFKYYYGLNLYNKKRADEAIPQIRFAIDKGISTSINYFNLAAAQTISRQQIEAEKTYIEALQLYPRSIFLRTAYASFLKSDGREAEAQSEFEKARQVNRSQAVSWQIAQTEGLEKLTRAGIHDKNLLPTMSLTPVEAVYPLIEFQKSHNPDLVRSNF